MTEQSEGWAFVYGRGFSSKKAHYIVKRRSLCGKYSWFGPVEQGNDESPDNCKACVKKLKQRRD